MAKRVFELAKELDVSSKAILDKCRAEGIPNINNHMSSLSAGLEATIKEWFTTSQGSGGAAVATAVETTEKVDLQKAKARRKARPLDGDHHDDADHGHDAEAPATVAPAPAAPAPPPAPVAPAAPAPDVVAPAPVAEPTRAPVAAPVSPQPSAPASPSGVPTRPSPRPVAPPPSAPRVIEPPKAAPPRGPEPLRPAASAPGAPPAPHKGPGQDGGPGRPAPSRPEVGPRGSPVMNVPQRPTVVAPAGPQLDIRRPATLSGPKVVRIEAPEVVDTPRRPRPMGPSTGPSIRPGSAPRGGGGVMGPPGAPGDQAAGRNKRRLPDRPAPTARRSGKADSDTSGFNWRQQDLAERDERLARAGGFLRQRRREMKKGDHPAERALSAARTGGVVRIAAPFTIKDLSAATGVKASDIVKKLFMQNVVATVNSGIEPERAQELMIDYNIDLQIAEEQTAEDVVAEQFSDREAVDLRPRPPVVTIMGHVDHGKTSLLDRIRNTKIAEGEAGGITQSTRAFRASVEVAGETKHVVFLDTPGHEAFTAMRARGANMTDVVVLVIAADDGVMPQTVESINHAKAAGVSMVVALNKIDRPEATESNVRKILGQLAEQGLNPVEWGGDTEVVRTSAVTGQGIDELLETLDYQAQLRELKADYGGAARGVVIESKIEEGRGPTATILMQNGLLEIGDFIVAGRAFGRVRDILDDRGQRQKNAEPSTPVRISGLDELPDAGDKFYIVDTLKQAQEAAEQRRMRDREKELAAPKATLDSILSQLKAGETKELLALVKADVQGSVDVLRKAIEDVSTPEVRVRVVHAAVGGINESDVLLAEASRAIIIGFNVIASGKARQLAEQKSVEIRPYQVIYDIVDDMKRAAEGLLAPELKLEVLGHAEVRKVFRVTRVGAIAGCYVTDGVVERNALIRVTRGGIVIESDRTLEQLKRFKDDVKDVRAGQECGMKIVGYDDIKDGDVLECYRKVEVRRTLAAGGRA